MKHSATCSKYFEEKYWEHGLRTSLEWDTNPVRIFKRNAEEILPSVLQTPKTFRKPPTVRKSVVPNKNKMFRETGAIKYFTDITENLCPVYYKFQIDKEEVTFHKLDDLYNIRFQK